LTQHNINLSKIEEEFLIKKLGLSRDSSISLALQIKTWLLKSENVSDVDQRYKELRNNKLDVEIKIKNKQLSFMDSFDSEPSEQANKAIKKNIEHRELTDSEYENILKYITLKNHNFKWIAKCDICKDGDTFDTRTEAIKGMIYHLSTEHSKKVMEMR